MTDRVQVLTGHSAAVQALVDGDLAATLAGPRHVKARLEQRDVVTNEACYRALLDRAWQERATGARNAAIRAGLADARDQQQQTAKGGNR